MPQHAWNRPNPLCSHPTCHMPPSNHATQPHRRARDAGDSPQAYPSPTVLPLRHPGTTAIGLHSSPPRTARIHNVPAVRRPMGQTTRDVAAVAPWSGFEHPPEERGNPVQHHHWDSSAPTKPTVPGTKARRGVLCSLKRHLVSGSVKPPLLAWYILLAYGNKGETTGGEPVGPGG